MNKELLASSNVSESFDILKKYYDLENCKPGTIVRKMFIEKLTGSMASLGAKPRAQYK